MLTINNFYLFLKRLLIIILLLGGLIPNIIFAGNTGIITGIVYDDTTGTGLSWVSVAINHTSIHTFSDIDGHIIINSAPEGIETLTINYIRLLDTKDCS